MSDVIPLPSDQVEDYAQGGNDFSISAAIAQQNLQFVLNEHFEENEHPEEKEVPKENNGSISHIPHAEENNLLWPVHPGESGEGLPYAPIDWPEPGDCWTWRVGRRLNTAGYFQDRFLYLPKRLGKQCFSSKPAVVNYLKTYFPEADMDTFFASFVWKIPAKIEAQPKELPLPPPKDEIQVVPEEEKKEEVVSGRKRRSCTQMPDKQSPPDEVKPAPKRARQSAGKSSHTPKQAKQNGSKSIPRPKRGKQNEGTVSPTPKRKTRRQSVPSNENGAIVQEEIIHPIPEDFDNYLSSLEDIITQPPTENQLPSPIANESAYAQHEMAEARQKLSSLLVMDFPSLISSMNISDLTSLASKLRKDPRLNAEQLVKLKLIEEIPTFSEVFLESRELIEQVDEFFTTLESKKVKVASLKNEYNELKEKADHLQTQMDSSSMSVQEIDNQIALLQARRAELTHSIENNKAAEKEVTSAQTMVANAIPKVVQQIQLANARMPELELKKTNAIKREAEILAKFVPLQGFSL